MRIAGTNIPDEKKLEVALTYLYGVGKTLAIKILQQAEIDANKKVKDLNTNESSKLRGLLEKLKIEGELRREISGNIKRLKDIKCYRGTRHIKNLPVRGQRTKTNSRTARGNVRKTMASGRRKMEKK